MSITSKKPPLTQINDMDPVEIQILMKRAGVKQSDIARKIRRSNTLVSRVIKGDDVSHLVRQAIADETNVDIKRIWPSTYLYNGGPRKPGRPAAA